MNLEGILSISGKPGLYKLVSQAKNTLIVEGLTDSKRFPLYASHQVSVQILYVVRQDMSSVHQTIV